MRTATNRRIFGLSLLVSSLACCAAIAEDVCCEPSNRGAYASVFGGAGSFNVNNVNQVGTALFPPAMGGPLNVNASASGSTQSLGLAGAHLGYEAAGWRLSNGWSILPAAEFEGFYMGGTESANVSDPNNRLAGHIFADTFPMDCGVFLSNAVVSLQTPSQLLAVYAGGGVGAANIAINGANSPQILPPEPGVNHFNSNPNSSDWGFTSQVKAGLRVRLGQHLYLFTEYRFLYVGSTTYTFGSTQYPTHAATTPWTVHFGDMFSNLGVAGVGVNF